VPGTDAVLRVVLPNGTRLEVPERDPAVVRLVVEMVLRQAETFGKGLSCAIFLPSGGSVLHDHFHCSTRRTISSCSASRGSEN